MKIAIVGAGLIGRMCAWQCSQLADAQIEVFEKSDSLTDSCAWVAAAMLSPLCELEHSELAIFQQGMHALNMWPTIIKQLSQQSKQDICFHDNGSLVLAHPQEQRELNQFVQQIHAHVDNAKLSTLNKQQLTKIFPNISPSFSQGLLVQPEACLDNRQLLAALETIFNASANIHLHFNSNVEHIAPHTITVNQQSLEYDWVIDCRGHGAVGSIDKLRGVRGEIIWVKTNEVSLNHPVRLMHPRYRIYIAPHADNIFAVGATQIESESVQDITVRSSLELLSALYSVSNQFGEAEIIGSYSRLRPAFEDNLPKIIHHQGLIQVNGLFRHGFLLAPIILNDVMSHIQNNKSAQLWPDIHVSHSPPFTLKSTKSCQ